MTPVVLITGCSSGFGRAMVPAFAKRGWRVVAGVRGGGAIDGAEVLDLDITNAGHRQRAAALDRIDCLVNNAGWALFGPFEESSEEEIRAQLETNLIATMFLTKALLPQLRAGRGRIVNVSSVMGYFGFPMMSVYAASKFALEGWSESLRHELRPHGVEVALVEPGGHRTRFAENARWPAAALDVYARQRERFRALRQSLTSKPALPLDVVAERIAEMATSTKPMPLRLRLGRDARAAWLLRKLPSRLAEAIAARTVERSLT